MKLYKIFVYTALIGLTFLILVPVLWVVMASVKETAEHYGNPWALPTHIHWQNFVNAWTKANMGGYMLHSVTVTALALGILLVVALPASYCLARFHFVGRRFLNTCFMAGLFINVNYIVVPIYLMLSDGDKWITMKTAASAPALSEDHKIKRSQSELALGSFLAEGKQCLI